MTASWRATMPAAAAEIAAALGSPNDRRLFARLVARPLLSLQFHARAHRCVRPFFRGTA
jgi:hypothetical protein